MANLERSSDWEQSRGNRDLLAFSNRFTRDKDIYAALVQRREPIEIVSQDEDENLIYCPKEKIEELKNLTWLLKLSPQYQLLEAASSVGSLFSKEKATLLNDVLNKASKDLTENEQMLFDSNYRANYSPRPLLYTPFGVSKEVRGNIIKTAKQAQKENARTNTKGSLLESVRVGTGSKDTKEGGVHGKQIGAQSFFNRLLRKNPPALFEIQLMEQAYDDLINNVGGRDFFSRYQLYTPRRDEMIRNDFTDPALLLMEDLERRGYDINLFRVAGSSGAYRETEDGIDDCIVAFVGEQGTDLVDKLSEPMVILNHLYRGRGVLYSSYIDYTDHWAKTGFSEEERKRLIAFARLKEVGDEESNFRLNRKNPDPRQHQYWEEVRTEIRDSRVEPADQIFLRRTILRMVDQAQYK